MQPSIIIIDDFLGNPDDIRAKALGMDYQWPDEQTTYPGRNSSQKMIIEGLEEQISTYVGEAVRPTPDTGHANCRITLAGDEGKGNIHMDSSDWSGILYLSLPEDCQGGTDFFRHKATNTERAPITATEIEAMGYSSFDDVVQKILKPDGNNFDKWEKIMTIPMRYNRLVLLRPWLWHNAGPAFGDTLENGRLVHLMFFSGPNW